MGQVYTLYKSNKRERADRRRLVFFFLTNWWNFCQKVLRIRSHGYFESYACSAIYWVGLYHYFSPFMFSANPHCCMQVFRKPISVKTNRKRRKYLFTFWDRRRTCSCHYIFFELIPYHRTYTYTNWSFHCRGNKWSKLRLNYELPMAA